MPVNVDALSLRWRSEFEAIESTIRAVNKALSASLLGIKTTSASPGGPTTLPREAESAEVVGANWHCGWRCEFQSFESTVEAINEAL
jgi:hypothetical protein